MAKKKSSKKVVKKSGPKVGRPGVFKEGPSKSDLIREYLKDRLEAGPKEVREALAKKGVVVTDALVSNVKRKVLEKAGKKPGRPSRVKRVRSAAVAGEQVNVSDLIKARDFAERVGGVDNAKEILATLGKISG